MDAPVICDACGDERFLHDSAGFVSYCFASGDGPDQRVASLAWCVRISFGGEVQRRDVPASERALREAPRPQSITCFYRWIGTRPRGGARTYGAAHARVRSLAHKGDAMSDRGRITMGVSYRRMPDGSCRVDFQLMDLDAG